MKKTILIVAVLLALCFPLQTLAAETSEDPLEPETKSWYTFEGLGVDEADLNARYNALQDQLLAMDLEKNLSCSSRTRKDIP